MDSSRSERMRPLSIADYLDRLGSSAGEKAPPRPEGSPFRPRSLPSPQTAASGAKPVFDRLTNKGGETQGEEAPRRTPWAPKPVSLESAARGSAPTGEPAKPEDICRRSSPTLTPAAASRAFRKAASRGRTATRPSSPQRGSWRKRSSKSFVARNQR